MCGAEKVRHMLMGEQVLKKWKKSKKMTVAFGGILVMSVVIGGCGGREDAKKSIKIGISVYDQYDTFVSEMMKDFNDYATKKEEETGVAINIAKELMGHSSIAVTADIYTHRNLSILHQNISRLDSLDTGNFQQNALF